MIASETNSPWHSPPMAFSDTGTKKCCLKIAIPKLLKYDERKLTNRLHPAVLPKT